MRRASRALPITASTSGPGSAFHGSAVSSSALVSRMRRQVASRARWGWAASHASVASCQNRSGHGGQSAVRPRRRADPPALGPDHGGHPRQQIAEIVGQVGVVTGGDPLGGEVPVRPEGRVPHQVVADGIDAELGGELSRGDLVEARLGHLLAADQKPSVNMDVRRWIDAGGHAHRRPPHAVEPDDLLADQVVHGRPPGLEALLVLAVADGGDVVDQGVVPDVEDVLLVPRNGHTPVDRGPGDGDVTKASLDEAQGLVPLRFRYHRAGFASYQSMSRCSKALSRKK